MPLPLVMTSTWSGSERWLCLFRPESTTNTQTGDKSEWALGAHYAINGFYFAGMYTQGEGNDNTGYKGKGRGYELAATYNVDAWTFLAGYNFTEAKENNTSYQDQLMKPCWVFSTTFLLPS